MLAAGVIRPSESEWASAPVLIRKKDGTVRWCIDYRALNDKTVKDQYPLPLIEDCLDTLSGTEYFSTVKTGNAYTLLVGRVVDGMWVVCGPSKGSPHEGYQWASDGSSVGHRWVTTRPPSTWHTHDPQASYLHLVHCITCAGS